MSDVTRDVVVAALHRAVGLLNEAGTARTVMAGGDIALDGIEMDSLSLFEVIMEIEDRLGIELDADEVSAQPTLGALITFVARAQARRV